jgi:uncharacterized protein
MLEMKGCGRCGVRLSWADIAYICSYECTYCSSCFEAVVGRCPNCSGQLVVRPIRSANATDSCRDQSQQSPVDSKKTRSASS